jgi:hypothetical protein
VGNVIIFVVKYVGLQKFLLGPWEVHLGRN